MAKVLPFESLRDLEGTVVYEEWLYGTGTQEVRILVPATDNLILMENLGGHFNFYGSRAKKEYRYWDSPPTQDERETTPWL